MRLALLLRASLRLRGDGLTQSVVLLRPDFPEVDTSLGGYGLCRSGRSEFSNDAVDGPAATADYKHVLNYPVGRTGGTSGTFSLISWLPVQSGLTAWLPVSPPLKLIAPVVRRLSPM